MTTTIALADLPSSGGVDLGRSAGRVVTQAEVDAFGQLTGDEQWIHVDPERAEREGLGGTIVHGYFVLSLLGRFWGELLDVTGAASAINYGLDRIRFTDRVPVGSTVFVTATIATAERRPDGVKLTADVVFRREGHDRPIAVATSIVLFLN